MTNRHIVIIVSDSDSASMGREGRAGGCLLIVFDQQPTDNTLQVLRELYIRAQ